MTSIRGTITAANTKADIYAASKELLEAMLNENRLDRGDVLSVIFAVSPGLTALAPSAPLKELGLAQAAALCAVAQEEEGGLVNCIHALLTAEKGPGQAGARHVSLRGAAQPDPHRDPVAVAIDGPSGAGKSTLAKKLAKALGFIHVDSGAMYRAVGLYCLQNRIDPDDREEVAAALADVAITFSQSGAIQHIHLNGRDVTADIREHRVSDAASKVAAQEAVRDKVTALQRELAKTVSLVMDGRDIGSAVLPGAQVKVYLDASLEVRAQRRAGELRAKGEKVSLAAVQADIAERDYRDTHRKASPLVRLPEAVYIDSSEMSEKEVLERLLQAVAEKGKTGE